jgi:uncharacterized coiled-coil DUF342 family protein
MKRAFEELTKGFEDLRRATEDINAKQAALYEAEAELKKMQLKTLAADAQIKALGKSMEQLAAASKAVPLNQLDEAQFRQKIDELIKQIETLRAR